MPSSRLGLDAGCVARLADRRDDPVGDVLRPAVRRGRVAGLAEHVVLVVDHDGLDLRAAEVDTRSHWHSGSPSGYDQSR